jgi:hypothetical protein
MLMKVSMTMTCQKKSVDDVAAGEGVPLEA